LYRQIGNFVILKFSLQGRTFNVKGKKNLLLLHFGLVYVLEFSIFYDIFAYCNRVLRYSGDEFCRKSKIATHSTLQTVKAKNGPASMYTNLFSNFLPGKIRGYLQEMSRKT
jgi:hypothetical protein